MQQNLDVEELKGLVLTEVVRRRLLPKYDKNHLKGIDGQRIAQCTQPTLKAAVDRVTAGLSVTAPRGRPPLLSPVSIRTLQNGGVASLEKVIGLQAPTMDELKSASVFLNT